MRGVKNSCVARKYVCGGMCCDGCDCKRQPRTMGGIEPKRIVGDLYLEEKVEGFAGCRVSCKYRFWLCGQDNPVMVQHGLE